MKKYTCIFLFLVLCLLPKTVLGADFEVKTNTSYYVDLPPITKVTHQITIKNLNPTVYLKAYSLVFSEMKIENLNCLANQNLIPCIQYTDNGQTHIKVDFQDVLAGSNMVRLLEVSYNNLSLVKKDGNTTDIFLPSLSVDNQDQETIALYVNKKLGDPIYFSQKPKRSTENGLYRIFHYDRSDLTKGVWSSFGTTQYYAFHLTYHLNQRAEKKVALPPDTAYQEVYLDHFSVTPKEIVVDLDGNWLATFPKNTTEVTVTGQIQVYPKPRLNYHFQVNNLPKKNLLDPLWTITDEKLLTETKNLLTPEEIKNYVVKTLSYDREKINAPTIERLGADKAFQTPLAAVCSEYTDLFVAIARSKGIYAQEINGYTMNESEDLEPTLFNRNILHAWPQYPEGGNWRQIDPTWEDTGGRDYFKSFDLKHLAFVIHGQETKFPQPPDDYRITYGKPFTESLSPEVKVKSTLFWSFYPTGLNLNLEIKNLGHTSLNNEIVTAEFATQEKVLAFLPPFAQKKITFLINLKSLYQITQNRAVIFVGSTKVTLLEVKKQVIFLSVITFFIPIIVLLTLLLVLRRK
jgi:transglutaminase-like putative cysteine protease